MASSRRLKCADTVVIVTGGCNGIGRACADVFVEEGAKVVVLDIDDEAGNVMSTEGPGGLSYIHCDLTNEEEIKNAVQTTVSKHGKLNCLINNAGIVPMRHNVDEVSVDEFRRTLEINLVSYYTMIKYCIPHLRASKGTVINVSSISATLGFDRMSMYVASKGGVAALTRALAIDEAKHGVRVNTVVPGSTRTNVFERNLEKLSPEQRKQFEERNAKCILLQRSAEPREIALACLYLATDATFTTGIELNCSGGVELGYGMKM